MGNFDNVPVTQRDLDQLGQAMAKAVDAAGGSAKVVFDSAAIHRLVAYRNAVKVGIYHEGQRSPAQQSLFIRFASRRMRKAS